jgi:hypothetical protein
MGGLDVNKLKAELARARQCARVIAHAWDHDCKPPDWALEYARKWDAYGKPIESNGPVTLDLPSLATIHASYSYPIVLCDDCCSKMHQHLADELEKPAEETLRRVYAIALHYGWTEVQDVIADQHPEIGRHSEIRRHPAMVVQPLVLHLKALVARGITVDELRAAVGALEDE